MKSTKKSLVLSTLSLMMCVAMLLGTTYAWFTDSVTSGKNIIAAGNLDIELYANGTKVDGDTKLFSKVALWEPGAVAFDTLQVKNVGNLALKYQLSFLFENETKVDGHGLSDVLKIGTYAGEITDSTKREDVIAGLANVAPIASFAKSGNLAANTDDTAVTYVVYWEPGDNDNLYNMNNEKKGKELSIDFYVNLVATQDTVEADSFDNQYDKDATYPVINSADLEKALDEAQPGESIKLVKDAVVELPSSNYTLPAGVSISGEEGSVLKVTGNNALKLSNGSSVSNLTIKATNTGDEWEYNSVLDIKGNNVKVENVTITSDNRDSPIKIGAITSDDNEIVIKDSTIDAAFKAIYIVDGSKGKIIIDNCNISAVYPFNVNTTSNPEVIVKNSTLNGWTSYGGTTKKVTFTDCNFGAGPGGYAVLMAYADTELTNCTFSSDFEVYTKNGSGKTITFTNCNKAGTKITSANVNTIFDDTDSDSIKNAGWTVTAN